MIYYAFLKGKGEGCDYTVACNQKLVLLKAADIEAAKKEVKELVEYHSVSNLEKVTLLEVANVTDFDLQPFHDERR